MSTTYIFCLNNFQSTVRNRFALTVICCIIYHCLEVSRKKWIKSRARSASGLSTYDWPTDSDILCNKSLKARIYFDSNTQKDWISERFLQFLQRFSHFERCVKVSRSACLDCIARVYIRFERFFVVKNDVTQSNVASEGYWDSWRHEYYKMASEWR